MISSLGISGQSNIDNLRLDGNVISQQEVEKLKLPGVTRRGMARWCSEMELIMIYKLKNLNVIANSFL